MEDKTLIKIAFTPELVRPDEVEWIKHIIDAGWDAVHLRHPNSDMAGIEQILAALPSSYLPKIHLHSFFSLSDLYPVGGIHINRRVPYPPTGYSGIKSKSCHSIEEADNAVGYDYVTLSPVFDSISKSGYHGKFSDISSLHKSSDTPLSACTKVIALGGITPSRLADVSRMGFDGFATLGYLSDVKSLQELDTRLNQFEIQPCYNS